jgi:hypothetical protein
MKKLGRLDHKTSNYYSLVTGKVLEYNCDYSDHKDKTTLRTSYYIDPEIYGCGWHNTTCEYTNEFGVNVTVNYRHIVRSSIALTTLTSKAKGYKEVLVAI